MAKLTRDKMFELLCRVYPSLEKFTTNSDYNGGVYVHRASLVKMLFELKIYKSKLLTKEEKYLIKMEIVDLI